jgi:mono/diheme cytochrome c family protein
MKKFFRYFLYVVALLVVALLGFMAFVYFTPIPSYEVVELKFKAEPSPEKLERGFKLVSMLCAQCHRNPDTGKLTGQQMLDAPPEFGYIYSPNITQDKQYGIGDWTDGEILYLLRTGIKRDGQYAPPYMAKLPNMADEDIESIIAFLRSDHPMVAADPTPDTPTRPSFFTKILSRLAFKPFDLPEKGIPMPDTTNQVELGRYLAYNLECFSCHSADFTKNDYLDPEKSEGYFGGGNKPLNREGKVMLTPNLTFHDTGIARCDKSDFIRMVRFGTRPNGPALRYPMIPYVYLTDYEAGAIYEYLKTIPPINNEVPRSPD